MAGHVVHKRRKYRQSFRAAQRTEIADFLNKQQHTQKKKENRDGIIVTADRLPQRKKTT